MASTIDVIIPVHTERRPIERAVSSVLSSQHQEIRAIVVCHGIGSENIKIRLNLFQGPRLTIIEHHDRMHSPAGPLNAGVLAASADYLAFLGSDDEFDAGSLDAWHSELRGQDVHIGQLIGDSEGRILAPAPRTLRFDRLDASKDLLNYRTAPVGALLSRALVTSPESPRFIEGLRTGEDIALGAFLWNTAARISYSRHRGGYRVRESGEDRVTIEQPPLTVLLEPVEKLLEQRWLSKLSGRAKSALAAKLIRMQVVEPCRFLARQQCFSVDEAEAARRALTKLYAFSSHGPSYLLRRDFIAAQALLNADPGTASKTLATANFPWDGVITANPLFSFAPEGFFRRALRHITVPLSLHP